MIFMALASLTVFCQEYPVGSVVMTDAGDYLTIPAPNNHLPSSRDVSITTLYASNNHGSPGGAVYFDIAVGSVDIVVDAFDINTVGAGNLGMSVYILAGGYAGNEEIAAAWGAPAATGTGVYAGLNNPSHITLAAPFTLSANTTYGIALVLDGGHGHYYTNGTGSNQVYSNADLTLSCGSATNVPFTGGVFTPRVWNGTVYYSYGVQVPLSSWALGIGIFLILVVAVVRMRRV